MFKSLFLHIILLSLLSCASCVKKAYDQPPDLSTYDPQLPVNLSIAELKSRYNGSSAQVIDSDFTISGIITADDRSGNFYKQIVIDDQTAAISIKIDANNLYAKYPVGRKVYVKLQGLYIARDAKLPVIGGIPDHTGEVSRLPSASIDNYIIRANHPNPVPTTRFNGLGNLTNINEDMLNRLVQVDDVQVVEGDTGKTYALQPALSSATNITLEDCSGNKIVLRTSGYASFQTIGLPKGRGSIKAIYSTFNNIPQLFIRDTSDVMFTSARCHGSTNNPGPSDLVPIDSLRKLYNGTGIKLSSYKITGIVISDAVNRNISTGSIILQDGNKGLMVYWGGNVSYNLGDSLLLDVTGDSLISFQGALELKRAPGAARPAPVVVGRSVKPAELTIAQLNDKFSDYESTLVRISNASVLGGGTYSGSKTLTDGTGSITLYTMSGALFAGELVPSFPRTFVGIVTPFVGTVTKELKLRNPGIDVY